MITSRNVTQTKRLTWQELVELEPGLDALLRQVEAAPKRSSTIDLWYGRRGWGFKNQLEHLVGWGRRQEHPVLSSSRAYNVAYQHLYTALERRGGGGR